MIKCTWNYTQIYLNLFLKLQWPPCPDNRNKKLIFKNYAPFTKCISGINNTQVDYPHDVDVVLSMYGLIEYSDGYSKISWILWQ